MTSFVDARQNTSVRKEKAS
ncbi:hypothetical protein CAJAP_05283 [Camponotus japonicus]